MRIKRFTAPDMRTALRMVREEQGPDAVILSNRATADGIEIVAATDYDEALVSQALRAAAPGLEANVSATAVAGTAPRASVSPVADAPRAQLAAEAPRMVEAAPVRHVEATTARGAELVPAFAEAPQREAGAPRESLITRARAIFRIGDAPGASDGPTLAELTGGTLPPPAAPKPADGSRFEEMMAAFNPPSASAPAPIVASGPKEDSDANTPTAIDSTPAPVALEVEAAADATDSDADYLISLATGMAPIAASESVVASTETITPAPRPLHAVAGAPAETDPTILAMRRELASMRELMERQMEQLSLERLRGSPARATAFETLLALGCDTAIAQAVAGGLDPRIAPADVMAPMLDGLVRALSIARAEPIEDGGVIALVGPTGAGKTTTAAKLAARFAARHRARDVALVSIDRERTGAREQLHALGRRLGVTVCDAENSDGLGRALEQLVDYPLVLVDTAGYGVRDRALLRQILWLRSSSRLRSLLVLPANANPHDLGDIARRYRPASPEGVVLTKLDESGSLGAALSILAQHQLPLAYTCGGQRVPEDLEAASAESLADVLREQAGELRASHGHAAQKSALEKCPGAAVNPMDLEDRHAFA